MHIARLVALAATSIIGLPSAHAAIGLIASGTLSATVGDLSGLTGTLENGTAADLLGGMGSGLAWAGGNTFLALPDRGPNAVLAGTAAWNPALDNTTSYIPRFSTVQLGLTASTSGALPFTLTPTLTSTTLLYSPTALNYGSATPSANSAGKFYFSGRSDNFAAGLSTNPANARLDPEAIRVSADGKSVFISDEYGPYVYQFDRTTGARIKSFALPGAFAISALSSSGTAEITGNTTGRVANKGMEGLAITPDGKTLVGFEQSPLIQDGGDGGRANRIVTIDVASGVTKQFAYDNIIGTKAYNSSEILALNDHQFLVLERDGKGLGDGSAAAVKQLFMLDLTGAQDVSGLTGQAALLAKAVTKTLFLDIRTALTSAGIGITDGKIPAKLEGMAFGQDVVVGGVLKHTLYIANDNDFLAVDGSNPNPNQWFVFGVSDADLLAQGASYTAQTIAAVPEPGTWALMLAGLGSMGLLLRRRDTR